MTDRPDHLIQGLTSNGEFRIIAAQTTGSVETVRQRLDLSPVAADAVGRAMTAAVLLARLLEKNLPEQRVTLRFDGDGPLGILVAEGTLSGVVRGYVQNPQAGGNGLTVGKALGPHGKLTVTRATPPQVTPYVSQVELVSGEVAKDVAHFLLTSEQIPSAVLLGVLNRPDGVAAAGGVVIQAFPHASEESIARLEEAIRTAPPLSSLIDSMSIEEAVRRIFEGFGYRRLHESFDVPVRFECSCSRERALAPISMFSNPEIGQMMAEGGSEVTCQYCGAKYYFSRDDLLELCDLPEA